jgi:hypothetical protein
MSWIDLAPLLLSAAAVLQQPVTDANVSVSERMLTEQVDRSGRCAVLSQTPEQKVSERPVIAPGQPPILSFKYYEDAKHHRFGNVDVMLDDAGH